MRALAVVLMLQGHTFHALLAPEFRSMDSFVYSFWHSVRGYTAPIFMFTAGTVFSYLLYKSGPINLSNSRVKKGLIRASILLLIAYFLRFPTFKVSQLGNISERQWNIFYSVDVLHLIAVGLVSIILISSITQRIKLNTLFTFGAVAIVVFGLSFYVNALNWHAFLPDFLAAYFTKNNGSLFPLFPWIGYIFAGAAFGFYLSNSFTLEKKKITRIVLLASILLFACSFLFRFLNYYVFDAGISWINSFSLSLWRLAIVLMLNSFAIYLFRKLDKLPKIVSLYGKHSLLIYIIHLIAIYGSAVVAGLSYIYGNSLTVFECLLVLIILNVCMIFMCYLIDFMSQKKHVISNFLNIIYRKMLPGVK